MDSTETRLTVLEQRVARLARRMGAPFGLGRSTLVPDDSGVVQTIQVQLDALSARDGIPVLYHHGFFSNPPVGSDMHLAYLDGDRAKAIVIASNHQEHRKTGTEPGDAGLYAHGHLVHLNAGGVLIVGDISHTGNYTLTGDLHVTGDIIAGFGGDDQVGVRTHLHAGVPKPTPNT